MGDNSDGSLSVWLRGRLESDIDGFVDDPINFVGRLGDADVKMNENAALAFIHGWMLASATHYKQSNGDTPITNDEMKQVVHLVRRRRMELLGSLREDVEELTEKD